MGHFLSAVISVVFVMLFIGGLMMFYTLFVCVNAIMNCTDEGTSVCVSQLCARRSVSTVAACLPILASASLDGAAWTAPVVSALHF